MFLHRDPWAYIAEPNSDGTKDVLKVRLTEPLPDELTDLATEIAEALRSALDQAAFATISTIEQADAKNTYFPIADSATKLESDVIGRGRCKDLHPDILALLRSFQPYKGGNNRIWALNRVCNFNKHRLLAAIGVSSGGMFISSMHNQTSGGVAVFAPRWDRRKNELVFAEVPIGEGHKLKYEIKFHLGIAFGKVEGVEGQEVLGTLWSMATEVENIVAAIEIEAKRLSLI